MLLTFRDFEAQGEEISALRRQVLSGRLVHALLLTGEEGIGKKALARVLAAALLCRDPGERPCGRCPACRMVENGDYPDLIEIRKGAPLAPDGKKDRATIPVEDIREMIRLCGRNTMSGGRRVVLVQDAGSMTPQAQNCLLKILEEPPPETWFILMTAHTGNLLTTVISRCRIIRMKPWADTYIADVLRAQGIGEKRALDAAREAGGSIGRAMRLAADEEYWKKREEILQAFFHTAQRSEILRISGAWKDRKGEAEEVFSILEAQTRRMLAGRLQEGPETLARFSAVLERIAEARMQVQANVNFQAVLEQLLLTFMGERILWQK